MAALLFFLAPQLIGKRIVREGLLADPKVLVDASDALRDKQYEPVLAQHRAEIETPFGTSWKGASKPDVTLVEFFDYACPYCKASNPAVERLLREDKGLRVVYREFPILGPSSVMAARLSLTASRAGRFAQFHDTLWNAGRPAPETLATASAAAGIATDPAESPDVEAGKYVKSRTTEKWLSDDKWVMESYVPGKDGKEYRCMEITYTRVK